MEEIKRKILIKLNKMHKWGDTHTTDIRHLSKGMPISVTASKQGQKALDKAIKELTNDGWLLTKKSVGSLHVYLSPRYSKEILEFIAA